MDDQDFRREIVFRGNRGESLLRVGDIRSIDAADRRAGNHPFRHREFGVDREMDVLVQEPLFDPVNFRAHGAVSDLEIENQQDPVLRREIDVLLDRFVVGVQQVGVVVGRPVLRHRRDQFDRRHHRPRRIGGFVRCRLRAELLEQFFLRHFADDPHVFRVGVSVIRNDAVAGKYRARIGGGCLWRRDHRCNREPGHFRRCWRIGHLGWPERCGGGRFRDDFNLNGR